MRPVIKEQTIYFILSILLLAGLLYFHKPHKIYEFVIVDNAITFLTTGEDEFSVPKHLRVQQGDLVTIKMTVNEDDELYIHEYDVFLELESGIQGEITFMTNIPGTFQMELKESETDLGILEVSP